MAASLENNFESNDQGYTQFYRLMIWEYASMFVMLGLFISVSVVANSEAVYVVAMQYLVSIIVNSFALYAIRQVISENVYTFPYGAGKLENFSAFLSGFFYVPFALYIIYDAVNRLQYAPEVGYLLSELPMVVSLSSMLVFYLLVRRIIRRSTNPSPLLLAYLLDFRIALFSDFGVLLSLLLGWVLVKCDLSAIGNRIDPLISLVIAFYMIWAGFSQVRQNFSALMDLPLSENEQLAIMRVLARHFDDYDTVGSLYSRASGKRRFVEIELGFNEMHSIRHVDQLGRKMELDLGAELPDLTFRIVPVCEACR